MSLGRRQCLRVRWTTVDFREPSEHLPRNVTVSLVNGETTLAKRHWRNDIRCNFYYAPTGNMQSKRCLPRCQCMTKRGTQCTRPAARGASGAYKRYCATHANCRRQVHDERAVKALTKYAEATLKELQSLR